MRLLLLLLLLLAPVPPLTAEHPSLLGWDGVEQDCITGGGGVGEGALASHNRGRGHTLHCTIDEGGSVPAQGQGGPGAVQCGSRGCGCSREEDTLASRERCMASIRTERGNCIRRANNSSSWGVRCAS